MAELLIPYNREIYTKSVVIPGKITANKQPGNESRGDILSTDHIDTVNPTVGIYEKTKLDFCKKQKCENV